MFVVDKKRSQAKQKIIQECGCEEGCSRCASKRRFVDKLADANVPAGYWFLKMKDFRGPVNLKNATQKYISNLGDNFSQGNCICFTGTLGTGKTYSSCAVLKRALMLDYDAYYTTLTDLVFYLTDYELKKQYYSRVSRADFLCIDEIDSRHLGDSEQAEGFFGRTFERIIRYRLQNQLPIILATNNAGLEEAFAGQFKKVVESLSRASTIVVPALGPDYRMRGGNG